MSDSANLGQISQRAVENVQVGGNLTIGNITQFVGQRQPSFRKPTGIPHNIPHSVVAQFVGRVREIETLHQQLHRTERVAISAISGMGGVGKTEMAIQYAIQYKSSYPGGVCWLKAKASNLGAQLIDFVQLHLGLAVPQELWGKILTVEQQIEWCWQHWRPSGLVLVVLDDVADLASCPEVLPPADRFRVLVTTRQRRLDPNFFELSLDVLSPEASLELLTALVGQSRIERELQAARKLCEWLGYLPLGLELVGRYLAEDPELLFTQMLERLEVQRLQDEAIANEQQRQNNYFLMTAQHSVRAAFELSWQEIDIPTSDVARLLGLFAPDVIPWDLVESTIQLLNWSEQTINNARKQLYKRNFIQQAGKGYYKVHPLIRAFLQIKLADAESANDLKRAFAVSMSVVEQLSKSPTIGEIQKIAPTIPHVAEAARALSEYLSDENLCKPFIILARFYEGQGLYNLAEPWRQQRLLVTETRLGIEHLDVAKGQNALAMNYLAQGRYSEAKPLFLQALKIRKILLINEHIDVAETLSDLAWLYSCQGQYYEAETIFLQAIELRKRFLGDNHLDVAETFNRLALLYSYQGRHTEAKKLVLQAIELRKRFLGDNHLDVAESLNNLGYLYFSERRYRKAKLIFEQAVEIFKSQLTEEHPRVALSLHNLGLIYLTQRNYNKAQTIFKNNLALFQNLLGDNHPITMISLANLASLYSSKKQYKKAEIIYIEIIEKCKKYLGYNHPTIAKFLNNLAMIYLIQGYYGKAESTILDSIKIGTAILGVNHPDINLYHKHHIWITFWAITSMLISIETLILILVAIRQLVTREISLLNVSSLCIGTLLLIIPILLGINLKPLSALTWLIGKLQNL
jgi:tetratricopeptide (TPR) repeat protein